MPVRYLTVEQRARRLFGRMIGIYTLIVPGLIIVSAMSASYVNVPAVTVLILGFLAAAGWGLRRAFEAQTFIDVDLQSRTCVTSEKGKRGEPLSLDTLAPLTVSLTDTASRDGLSSRASQGRSTGSRPVMRYVIHPAGRRDQALFEFRTADRARVKLEELASLWGISSQSYGGEVRSATQLDAPLHQRVSGASPALTPLMLQPEWGLQMQSLSPGYSITFTRPDSTRFLPALAYGVMSLLWIAVLYQLDVVQSALPPSTDTASQIVAATSLPIGLFLVFKAIVAFVRARPQPLLVTADGVRLGRHTLPFNQIEEVGWVLDVTIGGDRRVLRIPGAWFPAEAGPILVREIKRAISETAPLASVHI